MLFGRKKKEDQGANGPDPSSDKDIPVARPAGSGGGEKSGSLISAASRMSREAASESGDPAKELEALRREYAEYRDAAEKDRAVLATHMNEIKYQTTLSDHIHALESKVRTLHEENQQLRSGGKAGPSLREVRAAETENRLESDNLSLRRRIAELEEAMSRNDSGTDAGMQAELDTARAEIVQLTAERDTLNDRIEELNASGEVSEALSAVQKELTRSRERCRKLEQEIQKAPEKKSEETSAEARERMTELQDALAERNEVITGLEQQLAAATAKPVEREPDESGAVMQQLQEELDAARSEKERTVAALEGEIATRDAEITRLKNAPIATTISTAEAPAAGELSERYDRLHERIQEMQRMCRENIDRLQSRSPDS